ncbi:MAG: hypothetical protein NUV91_03955 [Candidatus Omnitrophica bacterium]|nr:hypothetical protein [Candidatus Omnitrophota bacterium]
MINNVSTKSKEELLEEFANRTSHNTLEGEQYTAAIIIKSSADIQASAKEIKEAVDQFKRVAEDIGKSSDRLSAKLFWLNVVLAIATVIGTVATAVLSCKELGSCR